MRVGVRNHFRQTVWQTEPGKNADENIFRQIIVGNVPAGLCRDFRSQIGQREWRVASQFINLVLVPGACGDLCKRFGKIGARGWADPGISRATDQRAGRKAAGSEAVQFSVYQGLRRIVQGRPEAKISSSVAL